MQRGAVLVFVALVLLGADVALPHHGRGVPVALAGILAALVIVEAVQRYRPARRLPWYLLGSALVFAGFGVFVQNLLGRPALFLPAVSHVFLVAGTLSSALAFALFVRARTRVLDRYQLLDLGVFGVSALTAFQFLIFDPVMESNPPVGMSEELSSVYLLILIMDVVLVARFAALQGKRVPATWYLLASTVVTVLGSVVVNATADADGGGASVNLSLLSACLIAAIGARHPSMAELTEPLEGEPPGFGAVRIGAFGLALFLLPLTAVLVHARTGELDPLMVLLPTGVVTVLVLLRLRLVFSREQAAREEVAAGQERFKALVQGISDVITVVDGDGTITYATDSAARALELPSDALVGRRLSELVNPGDATELEQALAALVGTDGTSGLTVRVPVADEERVFELVASDRTGNPRVGGLIVVLHDVTHRHLLEGELRHQASHDVLTGLPNRALFSARVAEALQTDALVSVLFVDLDDFKDVNDGMGHHAGDILLRAVAGRLQNAIREGDTVARLGGDEFAILVLESDDPSAAQMVGRRVLGLLEEPFDLGGQSLVIGASVGLAGGNELSVEDLLRHADIAMYRAKAAGKGTLALFEPGMQHDAADRISLHADLAEAIGNGELRLLFQPIYDLVSGRITGGEALVRWQHPTLGLLPPDRFIELAEDTGLVVPMGAWVLHEACRRASEWPADISVSVNLSARQLDDDGLRDEVAHALLVSGVRARRLVLEVTETAVVRDLDTTVSRLRGLRDLGVRIAMDDFGTGNSALSSVMELPVDVLKIDRSFITGMLHRPEAAALVQVLIAMGSALGVDVVAEGIEEPEQAAKLLELRCGHGQGFLYSRPVLAEAFRMLANAEQNTLPA